MSFHVILKAHKIQNSSTNWKINQTILYKDFTEFLK